MLKQIKATTNSPAILSKISRIPQRVYADLRLITLIKNWQEAIDAKLTGKPLKTLSFRNGIVLNGSNTISLAFLLQEIWIDEIYKYPGYHIKSGDVIIDIGANIGAFSTYAAIHHPDVTVYAYEPCPENFQLLDLNIKNSNLQNVKIVQKAVAGSSDTRFLHLNPFSSGAHSLTFTTTEASCLSVNCITLDEIFEEKNIKKCDLLKIDCEGSEYEIFENCHSNILNKVSKIICEYHKDSAGGKTGQWLSDFLEQNSFYVDLMESITDDVGMIYARRK